MRTNRALDLLGVPDLPVRAFVKEGGQIKPQGGSGGGSAPTQQTVTQTNIPEYARPYAESMLGQAQAITDTTVNPFQPYTGQRFAGFSPMQAQAFQNVAGQQVAPQITDASNLAYTGAEQGLGAQQTAAGLQQQALQYGGLGAEYGALGAMTAPQAQRYGAAAAGIGGIGVQQAQQGFGAGQAYAQQATSPEAMQAYMSPYMQNVVDRQQREAIRQSNIARQGEQARAVQQGAFGGSRSAIVEAEMQRNLGTQLADIQAAGLQRAYEQAQQAQQFGAGLGIQGLQAGYQGLGLGIQGQEAGMRGIQTGLQGTAQGIQGAQAGLQGVGQATGAGQYGLAGSQLGIQGAGQLGALGGQQFEQEMAITDALQKYGALQQQQQQQALDFAYQQEMARQQYPYQQLSFMSDLLRGVPSTQSAVYQYQQQPAMAPQLLGAGLAAYGAFGRKEGGQIKKYQAGGQVSPDAMSTMAVQELPSKLRRLSDSQLAAYARTVKDAITLSAIQSELTRRQRTRMPGGEMPQDTTAEQIAQRAEAAGIGRARVGMAGGGIVALQGGGFLDRMGGRLGAALGQQPMPADDVNEFQRWWESGPKQRYEGAVASVPTVQALPPTPEEIAYTDPSRRKDVLPTTPPPQQEAPPQQKQDTQPKGPGIVGAGVARGMRPGSFEEFRAMIPRGQMDPAQQAILNDMQSRITKQAERADSQRDLAKYDAALAAGLAMMGGTSLADGIARAAQQGGASYFASRKDAEKAIDNAEKAELAFRQYELEVMKGNEDAARKEFASFLDYTAAMANVDAKYAAAGTRTGLDAKDITQIQLNVQRTVESIFKGQEDAIALMPPEQQAIARRNLEKAKTDARNDLFRQAGITPPSPTASTPSKSGTTSVMGKEIQYTVD